MNNTLIQTYQATHRKPYFLRLCLTIGLLLMTNFAVAAVLTASVDRTRISANDTIMLTVSLDKQGADDIDFSGLELQFSILQRQRGSQTSIINGKVNAQTRWSIVLAPKETGSLIIPSFSSSGVFSDAITIDVTDSPAAASSNSTPNSNNQINSDQDVFLSATVDKTSLYVQEQLRLTLRLYYRISLSNYTPSDLRIENSIIEQVDERNAKQAINGINYNVLEKTYIIHPQTSGKLTIPAQTWQAEKSTGGFGFGRIQNPYVNAKSQAYTITIKPIPTESTATHWLPADNMTLTQKWSQSTVTAKVGEPLSYALTLTAKGLGHSQLPNISIDSNSDFTVYGDQANAENSVNSEGITGIRTNNYAIIPKKTGAYTLPPITLKWWNVATDQEEVIRLTSQKIVVANSVLNQNSSTNRPLPQLDNNDDTSRNATAKDLPSPQASFSMGWFIITALLAISSIAFLALWLITRQRLSHLSPSSRDNKTDTAEGNHASLTEIYKDIDHAIAHKEWSQLPSLLAQWAHVKTGKTIITNQHIIAHFSELTSVINHIEKQLYSHEKAVNEEILSLTSLLKQQKEKHTEPSNKSVLADLYPTQ